MKLDSRLTFSDHVAYIKSKTVQKIKLLSKLGHILDKEVLLQLYKTLILPVFDFGDVIYHKLSQQDSTTLQRLQNAACHAILQSDACAHISDLHADLAMLTLYQQHCQHMSNLMHNFLNRIGPPDCIDLFQYNHEIHGIATRQATDDLLYTPHTELRCTERDFAIMAPGIWNQVPLEIRKLKSHEQFKSKIKSITFN